jgi:hypothetical protein
MVLCLYIPILEYKSISLKECGKQDEDIIGQEYGTTRGQNKSINGNTSQHCFDRNVLDIQSDMVTSKGHVKL